MKGRVRSALAGAAALMVLLAGCTGGGSESVRTSARATPAATVAVPSAEVLAAALITPEDLPGDWTVQEIYDGESGSPDGQEEELGQMLGFCGLAPAMSQAAAEAIQWKAGRVLDQTVENPLFDYDETKFSSEQDPSGQFVQAGDYLASGDPMQIKATFDALRDGFLACWGDFGPSSEDQYTYTVQGLALPDVGDSRTGERTTGTWTSPATGQTYRDISARALVRNGPVLILVDLFQSSGGDGVAPLYTEDEFAHLVADTVTTAVGKLP